MLSAGPYIPLFKNEKKNLKKEKKKGKKKQLHLPFFFFFFLLLCGGVPVTIKSAEKREYRGYNISMWFSLRPDLVIKICGFGRLLGVMSHHYLDFDVASVHKLGFSNIVVWKFLQSEQLFSHKSMRIHYIHFHHAT